MIIITASIVSTIVCLRLHHKVGAEAENMPKWVRNVTVRSHRKNSFLTRTQNIDVDQPNFEDYFKTLFGLIA